MALIKFSSLLFFFVLSAQAAEIRPTNCQVVLMPELPIHTDRLQLRLVEKADEQKLMSIQSDPRVYLPSNHSPEGARLNFNFAVTRSVSRIMRSDLVATLDGEVVGTLSLTEVSEGFVVPGELWLEVGFVFDPNHWGKGFATESVHKLVDFAFTQIRADGLVAETNADNLASHNVLVKSGFTYFRTIGKKLYWKLAR